MQAYHPHGMFPMMMCPPPFGAPGMMTAPLAAPVVPSPAPRKTAVGVVPTKANKELFVGNVPKGTPEARLIEYLNDAMQRVGLCPVGYNPIFGCRISDKYAFVECVTIDDANSVMNLNGIPFMGVNLRISRPSKYNGPHTTSKTWQDIMSCQSPNNMNILDLMSPTPTDGKVNRELFVGNTTPEMTKDGLASFLGDAMEKVKLTTTEGNPITACHISGKFAFVEFRSVEETRNALNLNNIPYKGVFLKISRPSKYAGPQYFAKTWQEITGEPMSAYQIVAASDVTKFNRELFVGNITAEMTEGSLIEFLGNAMGQVELATEGKGNPIVGCRIFDKFAFLEFRSVAETTNALHLNNIPYLGMRLKMRRPSKYVGPETPIGDWDAVVASYIMLRQLPLSASDASEVTPVQQNSAKISEEAITTTSPSINDNYISAKPTRIVELRNMVTVEDLECNAEYEDIVLDTKEECGLFGTLTDVIIPRRGVHATKIFLEYETEQDAVNAVKKLSERLFDGQTVKALYCTEMVLDQISRTGTR